MSTIRILHLSDLQFGKKNRYNNPTPISNIETFAKSIADEVINSFEKIPPDMIVVTGDIAETASKSEYEAAQNFFRTLLDRFENKNKRSELYIVPGNHDIECSEKVYLFSWDEITGNNSKILIDFLKQIYHVDWAKTDGIAKTDNFRTITIVDNGNNFLSLHLNDQNTEVELSINNYIKDKFIVMKDNNTQNIYMELKNRSEKEVFDIKFFRYNLLVQSLCKNNKLCTNYEHPHYVSKACNDQILIIGLNSAIKITKDDKHGEISFKQIDGAIKEMGNICNTFRIAIVHHHFTRNSDIDQTNIRDADIIQHKLIDGKIQLLLHGHQHLASAELRRNLVSGNQIFILSTGSTSLKSPRPDFEVLNQYQLITLELEPTIKVSVNRKVFFPLHNRPGKWIPDISEATDGKFHFFIYPENIRNIVETIQEIGECQISSKTPAINFSNGFETSELYKKLLKNTKKRLWIFGRKNRKLFETDVEGH